MRLVKLKQEPIRVEGKYGVVIIELWDDNMTIDCIPDTLCEAVDSIGNGIPQQTTLRRREE